MTGYVQLTNAVLTEIESAMFGKNYSRRDLANASGISYPNITAILSRTRKQMRIRTAVKLFNTLDLVWSENDAQLFHTIKQHQWLTMTINRHLLSLFLLLLVIHTSLIHRSVILYGVHCLPASMH